MHYEYETPNAGVIAFGSHDITIKGRKIPYSKITSIDYQIASDYTTFFINGRRINAYGVRKVEAEEIKQTILFDKGEVKSVVIPKDESDDLINDMEENPEKPKEYAEYTAEPKTGVLWEGRKRLWCGLPWTFTKYRITDNKLFVDSGLLTKHQTELRLYRVLDVRIRRGLIQRLANIGSVFITSNDQDTPELELKNIRGSQEVKELLSEQVEEERQRANVRMGEFMGESADMTGGYF